MQVAQLVQELRPRAQNLKLADMQTGYVDTQELKFYVLEALKSLATEFQLDMFVDMNRTLVVTSFGIEAYPLPPNFYGWWAPRDERTSGLSIAETDGTDPVDLPYRDPARYHLEHDTETPSKPSIFTVAAGQLFFSPVPNDAYIVQGVHKIALDDGDDIPGHYAQAVKSETLFLMASDKERLTQTIASERARMVGRLVNNEARLHQVFRPRYSDFTRTRWR